MAILKVLIFLLVKSSHGAFFDPTDVDDPLSLFWHSTKDFSLSQSSSPCIVPLPGSGSVITGQCRHKTLCLLSGGQAHSHGNCEGFSSCCTRPTICARRTKAKVSYFTNDEVNFISNCEYVVETYNENVCQIRLDFEEFTLTDQQPQTTGGATRIMCTVDQLTVTPNVYNVPNFCGFNDGQHVYVHLYSQKELKLQIRLANRTTTPIAIPNPRWKIKVTQLECPGSQNFFTKHLSYSSGVDSHLLAPEGATQYFTEPSGRIRSFGFNDNGIQSYLTGLDYSIVFKPTPNTNCVRFSTKYIFLYITPNVTPVQCSHYLFVPNIQNASNVIESQICSEQGLTPTPTIFFTNSPPPHYIFFHSVGTFGNSPNNKHGFDINYELTTCST